jgi:hypothetical protein
MTQQNFSVKITLVLLIAVCLSCGEKSGSGNESFATFAVDPNKTSIEFFCATRQLFQEHREFEKICREKRQATAVCDERRNVSGRQ